MLPTAGLLLVLLAAPAPAESRAVVPPADVEAPVDATGTAAEPDPDDELALERAAQQAFADQRYEATVRYAAQAFELTGDHRHLYAQAHAERFAGNCRAALGLYARVMAATAPTSELGELARAGFLLCEGKVEPAEHPAGPTTATPVPATPEPAPVPRPSPQPAPRHWIRDPLGGVLFTVGLAGLAAGAGLWAQSVADIGAARRAEDELTLSNTLDRAEGFRTGAVVAFAAGAALLGGSVLRYGLVARRTRIARSGGAGSRAHSRGRTGRLSLTPAGGRGLTVGWLGQF